MEEGQEHFFVHFLRHEIITLNPCSETVLTNVYFNILYLILQCENIRIIKVNLILILQLWIHRSLGNLE